MKIDIVVVYVQRYRRGHEAHFVPPITGIHLAAITPQKHQVRVIHQQVEPVPLDTDADLVALSFFSGFAAEAYRLADALRLRGRRVVAGGPHATFWPDEALRHFDAVVMGEAETAWAQVLEDAERGALQPRYEGQPAPLDGIPMPRYDLLPGRFFIQRVVQATRGCPFSCSFCTVPTINPGFRMRPVAEVLRDVAYDGFDHWWQRKVAWFWDDNLTARRAYIQELLRGMVGLRKWWLTQASLDIARDPTLLDLMERSGCIGVFFGIESFGAESLKDANKRQNRVRDYREAVAALHARGIAVMAGFIAGFDGDDAASVVDMADRLQEVEIDVPFMSILTPYRGTPLHAMLERDGRLLDERGWAHFNGYNVTFQPAQMDADELLAAHRALWRRAFSPHHAARRVLRGLRHLRPGAALLSAFMNGFYGLKQLRGNEPLDAALLESPAGGKFIIAENPGAHAPT